MTPAAGFGSPGRRALLLALPLLALGVLYFLPLANLFAQGGDAATVARILGGPIYWETLWNTFVFAFKVTALSLVLAYPLAAFARLSSPRMARLVIVCSTVPMWTSLLARTYAWLIILERRGVANSTLETLGLVNRPLSLVHNSFGALIGSVYIMLPLMVLALDAAMRPIDLTVVRAARTLGARPMQAFIRVFMPLSLSGVVSGCLLVFVLSLGFFVTPALLGGPSDRVFSMLIVQQINRFADFPAASALSLMFLAATVILLAIVGTTAGFEQFLGGRGGANVRLSRGQGRAASRALAVVSGGLRWLEWRATWIVYAVLCIVFLLGPYLLLLALSLADTEYLALPTSSLTLRWYGHIFQDPVWTGAIITSLVVASGAALAAVALGILAAVGLRNNSNVTGRILLLLFMVPAILPTMIYSVAAYFGAASVKLVDTQTALILAHAILGLPFVVVICSTALSGMNAQVERAARSLGASPAAAFRRVTLPLILPSVLTGLIIAFQTSFDEIVVSLFLSGVATRTLPKALWEASTLEVTPIIPAVAVLLVVIVMVFAALVFAIQRIAFGRGRARFSQAWAR